MRTLCADIGDILGCGACLAGLRRIRSGGFFADTAVSIEDVAASHVISMVDALPDVPCMTVDNVIAGKLMNGYQPLIEAIRLCPIPFVKAEDVVKIIDEKRCLVAIAKMLYPSDQFAILEGKAQAMKILRVFHRED